MVPTHLALSFGALGQPTSVPGPIGDNTTTTQPGSSGTTGTGSSPPPSGNPLGSMWIFLLPILVLVLMSTMTGNKKQQKQRAAMLSSLGKNDKVLTTGGVIGTIVELYDQEMVLRVDESSNTRIRFARSAVQNVLQSKDGARSDLEVKPNAEPANSR